MLYKMYTNVAQDPTYTSSPINVSNATGRLCFISDMYVMVRSRQLGIRNVRHGSSHDDEGEDSLVHCVNIMSNVFLVHLTHCLFMHLITHLFGFFFSEFLSWSSDFNWRSSAIFGVLSGLERGFISHTILTYRLVTLY